MKEIHVEGIKCPKCSNSKIDFKYESYGNIRYYVCKRCGHKWNEKKEKSE